MQITVIRQWATLLGLASLLVLLPGFTTSGEIAQDQSFWVEEMAAGLNAPWSMAWLPSGELLITEKFGGIRVFRDGKLQPEPLPGGPGNVHQVAQSGLLDIVLDPDFATNQRLFIAYTEGDAKANRGAIYRARYAPTGLIEGETIFRVSPDSAIFPLPLAGRIQFLPDKTLLFTSSDDHDRRHLAQRLDNHLAKILRLDRDGNAPADNPFVDTPGALPEIYAYGTRAPLGITRDPRNGDIWEVENGPQGGDELNVIRRGANYGWPVTTYGIEYTGEPISELQEAPGIESPVTYWSPSIAPSSIALLLEDTYPQWYGDLFIGTLRGQHLLRVKVKDRQVVEQEQLLLDLNERIRDVRVGPDGLLYVLTDSTDGRLLRLRPGSPGADDRVALAPEVPQGLPVGGFPGPRPEADLARGEKLFAQHCMGCHGLEPGAPGIGPSLAGVFGRRAGGGDFAYSAAMTDLDVVWSEKTLEYYLASPQGYVPGTAMAMAPMTDEIERHDLIGFLVQATVRPAAP